MILAMLALAAAAPPQEVAVDMSWLKGYWLNCDDGRQVAETWSDVWGGVILGTGLTLSQGKVSWEQMRIGPSGDGYAFFASPSGQPAAEFRLVRVGRQELVFEKPEHDFPQRVIYRRDGELLVGRIEGTIDGKAQGAEWRYRAAPLNTRCPG